MLKVRAQGGDQHFLLRPVEMKTGRKRCIVRLPEHAEDLVLELLDSPDPNGRLDLTIREIGKAQLLIQVLGAHPTAALRALRSPSSLGPMKAALLQQFGYNGEGSLSHWFELYRRGFDYKSVQWRASPTFSIIMPVYKVRVEWLREAIESVLAQTYPMWELICVDDFSQVEELSETLRQFAARDARIKHISLKTNGGVSNATNVGLKAAVHDYVLFMDHDDVVEPHALARFADAASEGADLLYADEAVTSENIDEIIGVQARPAFAPYYYLAHPYFVHPVALKRSVAEIVGGFDPDLRISQDVDFMHRVIEHVRVVTHVPDILYRWRTVRGSAGHLRQKDVMAVSKTVKAAHLKRLGYPDATVADGPSFNVFSVRYFAEPRGRVLVIIPTKNQYELLRLCVESVLKTTAGLDVSLVVVDHQSDDKRTRDYLAALSSSRRARIVSFEGPFNYSRMNNKAVAECGAGYDHFLFLNNDVEARTAGWLEAMVDLADTIDVGAVGATLLYPDGKVQHGGVIVGMRGPAEHAFKFAPFKATGASLVGLHATREYSAVTAACMLVPSRVFHQLGGFDEELAVGFNDTDLCLRIGYAGYKVVYCADAVLIHRESVSRGKNTAHPEDTALFCERHRAILQDGDPFFSPLHSRNDPQFRMDMSRRLGANVTYRTWRQKDVGPR